MTKISSFSGGSNGGEERPRPGRSKFFQFHAFFGKIWQNCMMAPRACPPEELAPPTRANPASATELDATYSGFKKRRTSFTGSSKRVYQRLTKSNIVDKKLRVSLTQILKLSSSSLVSLETFWCWARLWFHVLWMLGQQDTEKKTIIYFNETYCKLLTDKIS